jgi:N-acetyl-gamma-glutamylphosphate reductase
VALPGCHATGFILLVRPLIDAGIVGADYPFAFHSITGYSGGGKGMIAQYEVAASLAGTAFGVRDASDHFAGLSKQGDETAGVQDTVGNFASPRKPDDETGAAQNANGNFERPRNPEHMLLEAPRQYALTQQHKHLPEMTKMAGLSDVPIFVPHVADYFSGISLTVPLYRRLLPGGMTVRNVRAVIEERYRDEPFVHVASADADPESGYLNAGAMSGKNDAEIFITGNEDRIILVARYDNLGKGASGAGVQCMNIMMGISEERGLLG